MHCYCTPHLWLLLDKSSSNRNLVYKAYTMGGSILIYARWRHKHVQSLIVDVQIGFNTPKRIGMCLICSLLKATGTHLSWEQLTERVWYVHRYVSNIGVGCVRYLSNCCFNISPSSNLGWSAVTPTLTPVGSHTENLAAVTNNRSCFWQR